jgi:hypothetical protein
MTRRLVFRISEQRLVAVLPGAEPTPYYDNRDMDVISVIVPEAFYLRWQLSGTTIDALISTFRTAGDHTSG